MAATLCFSITACGKGSNDYSKKKVLRIGLECGYAPFNWTQSTNETEDGNKAVPIDGTNDFAYGYDIMVAQKIADKLGWKLEVHKIEWSSIVLGLQSNQYDAIIAGMVKTDERDKTVDFSKPYYIRSNVMVVKKGSELEKAKSLDDFSGHTVTTQINTSWAEYCSQIPNGDVQASLETTSEVVMAVATGKVECAVLDEPTAQSAMIANPDITYVKFDDDKGFKVPEGQSNDCCIAVKEGNEELLDILNGALDGWTEKDMKETMDTAIKLQPLQK